jgi:hypothetical protein
MEGRFLSRLALIFVVAAGGLGLLPLSRPGSPLAVMAVAQDEPRPQLPIKHWADAEKTHRQLENPPTVDFTELPLKDCLRFVSEYHAVPFRTDHEAIEKAGISLGEPVTMRLTGVSMRNTLKLLLDSRQLGFHVEHDGLVITTRERAGVHLERVSYDPWRFAGKGISAEDLAQGIVATIAPDSWQEHGGQATLRVEEGVLHARVPEYVEEQIDALLAEVHRLLFADEPESTRLTTKSYPVRGLQNHGVDDEQLLEWLRQSLLGRNDLPADSGEMAQIEKDELILKQPAWVHDAARQFFHFLQLLRLRDDGRSPTHDELQFAAGMIPPEAKWHISHRRMAKKLTLKFDGLSLEDMLLWVRDESGLQIWSNAAELAERKTDFAARVILRGERQPVPRILDELLSPAQLDWYMIEPGVFIITTPADAARRHEVHVYPTKHLLQERETGKQLARRITKTIEPGSWVDAGGRGTARELSGLLIVSHHRRVQEEIERLAAEAIRPR